MAASDRSSKKDAKPEAAPIPGFDDFQKLIGSFKLPGFDVSALIDWQRKDLEALAEANRKAYEGIQALFEKRNEIVQETLAQWQAAMNDATGKDAMSKQAENAKQGMEQAMTNFRELVDLEAKARNDAWKVVQDRVQENLSNLQKLLLPKSK